MGLGPAAIKLNLELWQRGYFKGMKSAIDIGSQEMHIAQADFEGMVKAACVPGYDESKFKNLKHYPGRPGCSTKPFYGLLGLQEYACIDMNGEWGAVPHDLNAPLEDKSLYNKFDVVTDHGCNEHVFNVVEAYRTLHRLCKPGGLMVICQGVFGGNGYFLFDLSFFEGVAAANNLKILFAGYLLTLKTLTKAGSANQYFIPAQRDLLETVDLSKIGSISICYVLQKQSDEDFRMPYQDTYMARVYGHQGYQLQFLPDPPSRSYVPMQASVLDVTRTKDLIKIIGKRITNKIRKKG